MTQLERHPEVISEEPTRGPAVAVERHDAHFRGLYGTVRRRDTVQAVRVRAAQSELYPDVVTLGEHVIDPVLTVWKRLTDALVAETVCIPVVDKVLETAPQVFVVGPSRRGGSPTPSCFSSSTSSAMNQPATIFPSSSLMMATS